MSQTNPLSNRSSNNNNYSCSLSFDSCYCNLRINNSNNSETYSSICSIGNTICKISNSC